MKALYRHVGPAVNFDSLSVTFLICYCIAVILMFSVLLKTSNKEQAASEMKRLHAKWTESFFHPKQPLRPDPESDACFDDVEIFKAPTLETFIPDRLYIMSTAFYDDRDSEQARIRIIALANAAWITTLNMSMYCLIGGHGSKPRVIDALLTAFKETHDKEYTEYFITCSLKASHRPPNRPCRAYLSLAPHWSDNQTSLPLLGVQHPNHRRHLNFGVCVPPLWGVVNQNRLVEFIELTKLLGADYFYFYQYTGDIDENYSNPNTDQVLQYYSESGLVRAYNWNLPVPHENLWYFGQYLAIQHCLYSNMASYQHLFFTDIDEILVPRQNISTWAKLLHTLGAKYGTNHSSFKFRSAFFPPEVGESLITMSSTRRTAVIPKRYAKHMVQPYSVNEIGRNGVYPLVSETGSYMSVLPVRINDALVHHYRFCDHAVQANCQDYVDDTSAVHLKRALGAAFKQSMMEIIRWDQQIGLP